jgi:hypothetical protein
MFSVTARRHVAGEEHRTVAAGSRPRTPVLFATRRTVPGLRLARGFRDVGAGAAQSVNMDSIASRRVA